MKDLLITGCTNYIKDDMLEKLIDDVRVVVAGKNCVHRPGRRFYRTFPGEDSFNQLFDVYSFSSVLFVSGFADGGDGYQDELHCTPRRANRCLDPERASCFLHEKQPKAGGRCERP